MSTVQRNVSVESQSPRNLVILGAGGFAREVAWLVADINRAQPNTWNLIGFLERGTERTGQVINGVPVIGAAEVSQNLTNSYAVAAIGDPRTKERAVHEVESIGCQFATLVHPSVKYDRSTVAIGSGSIICAGNILTVNIIIGAHVIINLDCTIGHDSVIEDYVTISPGCHLSGYTTIRGSAFLGTGAVTIDRCQIGTRTIIGAGAVVVGEIPSGVTAMGVPAKVKRE
jgi:sugar O-acyltransferase (sialic acid O-acetyltransferase NeuD family)